MKVIRKIDEMQKVADNLRKSGEIIGLVPTMGYLHKGHLHLVEFAKKNSDIVIMSIYINPTQFAPNEDLAEYPRDFERDEKLAEESGVDIIFYPENMYDNNLTFVNIEKITNILCGQSRPTHFRGVATIVAKLFNITKPHYAVFGQKDAQQFAVIQKMTEDLNFDIELIMSPIIREKDGLAMSSRNKNLSTEDRKNATILYKTLKFVIAEMENIDKNYSIEKITQNAKKMIYNIPNAKLDYLTAVSFPKLGPVKGFSEDILIAIAVKFGAVRLIDNIIMRKNGK
ncbi:MAG: pantoate--beta-alanine ligase [Candidatus Marinimicrobia bacterium]|nr:pantoate--beta-alanine ligase [Candidatus Neomarinimicrobiota bacterium]